MAGVTGMSLTKSDRNFQSHSGRDSPGAGEQDAQSLAAVLSAALRREFGDSPAAAKRIAKLVRANPRAARNWLEGVNAPNGEYLVLLMRHSDMMLEAVLTLACRSELMAVRGVLSLHEPMKAAVDAIEALKQRGGPGS